MNYKANSSKSFTYADKEKMQKNCKYEDLDDFETISEMEAINNLCQSQNIQESLIVLINFTSDTNFKFLDQPPSNIITVINNQFKNFPANQNIIILCLQFIGNVWNIYGNLLPTFVDEDLLEYTVSLCLQKTSKEIAICGINSITNLIAKTIREGDKHLTLSQLDHLIFDSKPDGINTTKIDQILQLLDNNLANCFIILKFILNITRVYKIQICTVIINNAQFISLLTLPQTQILCFQILYNLALDYYTFNIIFTPEIADKFVGYAIDSNDPDVILILYSLLELFALHHLEKNLDNLNLWEKIKKNMVSLSQFDLTILLKLIEKVNLFYPKILVKYNFWPLAFKISENFSSKNKEGFAIILCSLFNDQCTSGNVKEPPLFYAANGGFQFLSEVLNDVENTFLFHNILLCLSRLLYSNPEVFAPIVVQLDLINKLEDIALNNTSDYTAVIIKNHSSNKGKGFFDNQANNEDDISSLIENFISIAKIKIIRGK